MKQISFLLILDAEDLSDDQVEAIYKAGCDDCTPSVSNGVVMVDFDKEYDPDEMTKTEVIFEAIKRVESVGFDVKEYRLNGGHLEEE